MATRTVAKDIITLRGFAAIISEFFEISVFFCELFPDFFCDFFKSGYAANKFDPCILLFF